MKDFEKSYVEACKAVFDMYEIVQHMDMMWFRPAVAMLVEEKCKAEGEDAVETFKELYEASIKVNKELGRY